MYTARIKLPADFTQTDVSKFSESLSDIASAYSALREENKSTSPWVLEWIIQDKPRTEDLSARLLLTGILQGLGTSEVSAQNWDIEKIPEIDWLKHSYKQFPPFSVGSFFIYGSHFDGPVPESQIGLQIDAATAFGSGEHETTQGCLEAMLYLKELGVCPWNILDMGTGSGILAIAAWKLWKTPVLAVDNDEEAVRVAEHHRACNHVPSGQADMICEQSDGFRTDLVTQKKPFELIIANILAGPLIEMVEDVYKVTDENGYIVLSGILNEQADDVLSVYESLDLALAKCFKIGDWSTLVLHNPPS